MAADETPYYLLVILAIVAVFGLGLSVASFATHESVGGMMSGGGNGRMGSGATAPVAGPGPIEWTILILSAAFLALAVILLIRNRGVRDRPEPSAALPPPTGTIPWSGSRILPSAGPGVEPEASPQPAAPVPEITLVKLLDEDERRMYLELREHGGQMYQRDLVALGFFSKAKVTRVLDKLEAKGLVVREAHGMTNRVRLVAQAAR